MEQRDNHTDRHVRTFPVRRRPAAAAKDTPKNRACSEQMRAQVLSRLIDSVSTTSRSKAVHVYQCALYMSTYHDGPGVPALVAASERLRNTVRCRDKRSAVTAAEDVRAAWAKIVGADV